VDGCQYYKLLSPPDWEEGSAIGATTFTSMHRSLNHDEGVTRSFNTALLLTVVWALCHNLKSTQSGPGCGAGRNRNLVGL